jgi:hypothetical protein
MNQQELLNTTRAVISHVSQHSNCTWFSNLIQIYYFIKLITLKYYKRWICWELN